MVLAKHCVDLCPPVEVECVEVRDLGLYFFIAPMVFSPALSVLFPKYLRKRSNAYPNGIEMTAINNSFRM